MSKKPDKNVEGNQIVTSAIEPKSVPTQVYIAAGVFILIMLAIVGAKTISDAGRICSNKILSNSQKILNDPALKGVEPQIQEIFAIEAYDTDANCLYALASLSAKAGMTDRAKIAFRQLEAEYSPSEGLSRKFKLQSKDGSKDIAALKKRVQQLANFDPNNTGGSYVNKLSDEVKEQDKK